MTRLNTNRKWTFVLALYILSLLAGLLAPVTAQDIDYDFPDRNDYSLPINISSSGRVSWDHAPDATDQYQFLNNYTIFWSDSSGRKGTFFFHVAFESRPGYQIPDFNPGLNYTVRVAYGISDYNHPDIPEVYVAWGTYGTALWNGATGTVSSGMADGRISPHAGTTLLVWIEDGEIVARDYTLDVELTAPADCSDGEQILAESDELKIECTAVDEFRVTQLVPQHPADGRRDILIFDAALTTCYRAYEYLESGALEVFWREC